MECGACGHQNVDGARFCANCGITLARKDPTNPLIGKLVGGRYRITRVIGEGGMGIVFEAEQQMGTTVRKVAVKTLHAELSRDPSVTARFHRECGTVAQLEHPNTIKVYDFGAMDDGTLYIAMEFLPGQPLDKVIASTGPMPPKRVVHLLQQVAGSLEEAHQQGIVHRDLKPENVILIDRAGERDVVKLLDFGIAARTESGSAEREAKLTQQGMVLGTPPYMSPEQFTGKALDRRSDIYSLGIMAYEMLTGHLPFDATTPWQWATEHMTAQPRPFEEFEISSQIPEPMRAAILKALAKDRDQRFGTVGEFIEALSAPPKPVTTGVHSEDAFRATAAMDQVPDFGAPAVNNPTAAMPAQPAARVAPAAPAPMANTPAARAAAGGGLQMKLIAAAAGIAVVGGGLVFALRPNEGSASDAAASLSIALPSAAPAVATSAAAAEQPQEPAGEPTEEPAPADEPPPAHTTPSRPAGGGGKTPTASTSKAPPPAKTNAPPASTKGGSESGGGSDEACNRCIKAAREGNYAAAASALNACKDPGKKEQCLTRARSARSVAVRNAVNAGNCSLAKQINAAASAMGAGASGSDANLARCK